MQEERDREVGERNIATKTIEILEIEKRGLQDHLRSRPDKCKRCGASSIEGSQDGGLRNILTSRAPVRGVPLQMWARVAMSMDHTPACAMSDVIPFK